MRCVEVCDEAQRFLFLKIAQECAAVNARRVLHATRSVFDGHSAICANPKAENNIPEIRDKTNDFSEAKMSKTFLLTLLLSAVSGYESPWKIFHPEFFIKNQNIWEF